MTNFKIITLSERDKDRAIDLFTTEYFPFTGEWVNFTLNVDPDGIYAAEAEDGKLLSVCGMCRYRNYLGFIFLYFTHPAYRRQGIGRTLFDLCVKSCASLQCVGLATADENVEMYKSSGFTIYGWSTVPIFGKPKKLMEHASHTKHLMVTEVTESHHDDILEFDKEIHPFPRPEFLKKFLSRSDMRTYVAIKENCLKGYGCLWKTGFGYRIMPLYARDIGAAKPLLVELLKQIPGESVVNLSIPVDNKAARHLVKESLDLECDIDDEENIARMRQTRMYKPCGGNEPALTRDSYLAQLMGAGPAKPDAGLEARMIIGTMAKAAKLIPQI